jgi:hypothetical protein
VSKSEKAHPACKSDKGNLTDTSHVVVFKDEQSVWRVRIPRRAGARATSSRPFFFWLRDKIGDVHKSHFLTFFISQQSNIHWKPLGHAITNAVRTLGIQDSWFISGRLDRNGKGRNMQDHQ